MPNFKMLLCRSETRSYYFEVEAPNEDLAREMGYEKINDEDDFVDWERAKVIDADEWVQDIMEIK